MRVHFLLQRAGKELSQQAIREHSFITFEHCF